MDKNIVNMMRQALEIMPPEMRHDAINGFREVLDQLDQENANKASEVAIEDEHSTTENQVPNIEDIEEQNQILKKHFENKQWEYDKLVEARKLRVQQLITEIENQKNAEQPKEYYQYLFPDAKVRKIIAVSSPMSADSQMLQLQALLGDSFCFLVYIDTEDELICKEKGDLSEVTNYDMEEDNKTYEYIRKVQTSPTKILSKDDKYTFLQKLGYAHGLRYWCGYEQAVQLANDAKEFVEKRNMNTTRNLTLTFATMIVCIALAPVLIMFSLPQFTFGGEYEWTLQIFISIVMGLMGAYSSLWFRYPSLEELTYGGRFGLFIRTFSRLTLGAFSAMVSLLLVRMGLLFGSFEYATGAIGLAGYIAGFSERFIPSLFKKSLESNKIDESSNE